MVNSLRKLRNEQEGFTLIELLVVILIIGILAAIALPTFLGQQKKAQNAAAKSDARNAVTQVESCLTDATAATAANCGFGGSNDGLNRLKRITAATASLDATTGAPVFSVTATSQSSDTFTISKNAAGVSTYTSTPTDAKWDANTNG